MNKIFLTSGVVLSMLSPAFATDPSGITASGGAAQPSNCVEDVLGVASGGVTLEPKWSSNISGAIILDAKRYTSGEDSTGVATTTTVTPNPVYSKYADGLYSDSTAETAVTTLTQTPEQTGYTFAGFFTSKYSGGTEVISSNGTVLPAASTQISSTGTTGRYYAQWTANQYSVTYNKGAGNGSNYTHTKGATYDSAYTIPTTGDAGTGVAGASTPATGYTFIGWTTSSTPSVTRTWSETATNAGTLANAWTGENPWRRTEDLTVYAAYLANQYTVSYLCGGVDKNNDSDIEDTGEAASGTVANQVVTYDSAYTLKYGGECSLKGYTFNGWSCTNGLSGAKVNGDPASGTWSIPNDSTCTAQWTANTIGLTWDNGTADSGGTGGAASCSYDSAITPLPTNPTKTGYTFDGWQIQGPFDLRTITETNLTSSGIESGYMRNSDDHSENAEIYRVQQNSTGWWGVTLNDGSKVHGWGSCKKYVNVSQVGDVAATLTSTQGYQCLCSVDKYQGAGKTSWRDVTWGNSNPQWVYVGELFPTATCNASCLSRCADYVQNNETIRRRIFGQ